MPDPGEAEETVPPGGAPSPEKGQIIHQLPYDEVHGVQKTSANAVLQERAQCGKRQLDLLWIPDTTRLAQQL